MAVKQRIEKLESKQLSGVRLNPKAIIICGVSPDCNSKSVLGYNIMGTHIDVMREPGESLEELENRCVSAAKERGNTLMFVEISKQRI